MPWYFYVFEFFAGAFLANGVPHFVQGISGNPFPSPFASPPGVGESSPVTNVLWGLANLLVGYALFHLFRPVGDRVDVLSGWTAIGIGGLLLSVCMAMHFGRVRGGKETRSRK